MSFPIDIVIPWVDGGDPAWQKLHDSYTAGKTADNTEARYRDWGTLPFWFRGISRYAPWVRTVHFVTWGHLPPWLNLSCPKLHVVKHEDYIPSQYLPTFSSHTIELNLHRIPGLAEHFLYFNDDVFLAAPTTPEDFFHRGLPRDSAVFGIIKNTGYGNFMPYIMLNMLAVINTHFDKRTMMRQHFRKWFTLRNGRGVLNNCYLAPWKEFTGFRNFHTCIPYCKSTFETVWIKIPDILDETCRHRFRCREDVNQYIFRYWQLVSGNFYPSKPNSYYFTIGSDPIERIVQALESGSRPVVCANDDPTGFQFEQVQPFLRRTLQTLLPEPCPFERSDSTQA